jgi:hypothetical protein
LLGPYVVAFLFVCFFGFFSFLVGTEESTAFFPELLFFQPFSNAGMYLKVVSSDIW